MASSSSTKSLWVFPGQGVQISEIDVVDLFEEFSHFERRASVILGYSLHDLCLSDKGGNLPNTAFAQPAIYCVCVFDYLRNCMNFPKNPDFLAGHSLGEYAALFAAGVFSFETGLKIVSERGRLMSECEKGTMAAIVGISEERVKEVLESSGVEDVYIANFNSPSQTVLSGSSVGLSEIENIYGAIGASFHWLRTSGAFHSCYMAPAKKGLAQFLSKIEHLFAPKIPVISNVTANRYPSSREDISSLLVKQLDHPVLWRQTIEYVQNFGDVDIGSFGPDSTILGISSSCLE